MTGTPRNGMVVNYERAFYFTVSDGSLKRFDLTKPDCGVATVCDRGRACRGIDWTFCNETFWRAEVNAANDNLTGLRHARVNQEHEEQVEFLAFLGPALTIGSRRGVALRFEAACCVAGFEFELLDVAENKATCAVGKLRSAGTPFQRANVNFILLSLFSCLLRRRQ